MATSEVQYFDSPSIILAILSAGAATSLYIECGLLCAGPKSLGEARPLPLSAVLYRGRIVLSDSSPSCRSEGTEGDEGVSTRAGGAVGEDKGASTGAEGAGTGAGGEGAGAGTRAGGEGAGACTGAEAEGVGTGGGAGGEGAGAGTRAGAAAEGAGAGTGAGAAAEGAEAGTRAGGEGAGEGAAEARGFRGGKRVTRLTLGRCPPSRTVFCFFWPWSRLS